MEELDFYAITEHLEFMSYVEWRRVEDLGEALSDNGRVLTLGGFELIVPVGHTNFFYADQAVGHDLRIACLSSVGQDLSDIWPKLDEWVPEGKVVAIRHYHGGTHQGDDLVDTHAARVRAGRGDHPDARGVARVGPITLAQGLPSWRHREQRPLPKRTFSPGSYRSVAAGWRAYPRGGSGCSAGPPGLRDEWGEDERAPHCRGKQGRTGAGNG